MDKRGRGRPHYSRSGDRRYIPVITESCGHVTRAYWKSLALRWLKGFRRIFFRFEKLDVVPFAHGARFAHQCAAPAPGPSPGLFLLSRKASATMQTDMKASSIYTSWYPCVAA